MRPPGDERFPEHLGLLFWQNHAPLRFQENRLRLAANCEQFKFGADFLHAEFKQFVYAYPALLRAAATAAAAPLQKAGG